MRSRRLKRKAERSTPPIVADPVVSSPAERSLADVPDTRLRDAEHTIMKQKLCIIDLKRRLAELTLKCELQGLQEEQKEIERCFPALVESELEFRSWTSGLLRN